MTRSPSSINPVTLAARLSALVAAAGLAAPALAAEEAHGAAAGNPMGFDLLQFVMAIVVFGVVMLILRAQVWPKILGGLQAREDKIRSEVFAAEKLRKEADAAKREFDVKLAEARAESARLLEQTKAEQLRLAADLRAKAEIELNEMRDQARANIEAAKRAAVNELYSHAAILATTVAGKILQREVNADDQRRLVDESMNELTPDFARA